MLQSYIPPFLFVSSNVSDSTLDEMAISAPESTEQPLVTVNCTIATTTYFICDHAHYNWFCAKMMYCEEGSSYFNEAFGWINWYIKIGTVRMMNAWSIHPQITQTDKSTELQIWYSNMMENDNYKVGGWVYSLNVIQKQHRRSQLGSKRRSYMKGESGIKTTRTYPRSQQHQTKKDLEDKDTGLKSAKPLSTPHQIIPRCRKCSYHERPQHSTAPRWGRPSPINPSTPHHPNQDSAPASNPQNHHRTHRSQLWAWRNWVPIERSRLWL